MKTRLDILKKYGILKRTNHIIWPYNLASALYTFSLTGFNVGRIFLPSTSENNNEYIQFKDFLTSGKRIIIPKSSIIFTNNFKSIFHVSMIDSNIYRVETPKDNVHYMETSSMVELIVDINNNGCSSDLYGIVLN